MAMNAFAPSQEYSSPDTIVRMAVATTNPYRPVDRLRGGGEPKRYADGQYAHAGKMKERKRDTM